jgi:hypothetical protein
MQSIHRSRYEKRMVAGIAATMCAVLGCSVGVLAQGEPLPSADEQSELQPFWSTEASASNLAVVELYRSGDTPQPRSP